MLRSTHVLLPRAFKSLSALFCSAIPFASSNPKLLFQYLFTQCLLCFLSQPVNSALQATSWFSSSRLSPLFTPAGSWGGSCTKRPGSPSRQGGRGEHGGARSGAIPVVHSKEVRCGSSGICLKHSLIKGQPASRKKVY